MSQFPLYTYSQALNQEIDKFNSDTIYSTGIIAIDGGYEERVFFNGSIKPNHPIELFVSVKTSGIKCFRDGSKIIILFDDGKKDTLISNYAVNCEGNLASSPIANIRFFGTAGYFDIELSKEENVFLGRKLMPGLVSQLVQKSRYPLY